MRQMVECERQEAVQEAVGGPGWQESRAGEQEERSNVGEAGEQGESSTVG